MIMGKKENYEKKRFQLGSRAGIQMGNDHDHVALFMKNV